MKNSTEEIAPVLESEKKLDPKMSKIKVAFLYVLIGGLVVSALISVVAILIGQFNEAVLKALLTTFIFVTHSLLILGLVSADKYNTIGKAIIPTTIFGVVIANLFTSTLGTWGIWNNGLSWRSFLLYTLLVGAAFIVTAVLKLRATNHTPTNISVYATVGFILLLTVLLAPWIFSPQTVNDYPLYYRIVGAVAILGATSLSLSAIFNRLIASKAPKVEKAPQPNTPGGMIAIYVVFGTIAGLFWLSGVGAFLYSAATANSDRTPYSEVDERSDYRKYR